MNSPSDEKCSVDEKLLEESIALFNEIFKKNMSLEAFKYKHFANPNLLDVPVTPYYEDDRLVSMQWNMGMLMNYLGRDVMAVTAVDCASAEDSRGFPFLRNFYDSNKMFPKQGISIRFGNPNNKSFPIVVKLGDKSLGRFMNGKLLREEIDSKPGGLKGLFAKTKRQELESLAKWTKDLDFSTSKTCPFSEDDFVLINNRSDKIFPIRTKAYYEWKVDGFHERFPKRKFRYLTIREAGPGGVSGRLMAYMIVEDQSESQAEIIDWNCLHDRGDGNFGIVNWSTPGGDDAKTRGLLARLVLEV
ncbi:MAG: hypothetical protein ACOYIK_00270, partial [Coriobacteriales bacterium]